MNKPVRQRLVAWLGAGALALIACTGSARAATPESPEVQALVAKAVAFLESDAGNDHRMGGKALVGLALLKNGAPAEHRRIVEAVEAIKRSVANLPPVERDDRGLAIKPPGTLESLQTIDIYSAGLAVIFLCALDPSQYGEEIQKLLDYLEIVQKDQGAWGYASGNHAETCDTSMTQYGALSAWEATQVGFRVPVQEMERLMIWLLRTQDPSGQYGYQGTVSDSFKLVPQKAMRHSMTAAGMGSVYICADLLGITEQQRRQEGLPPALKEVVPEGEKKKAKSEIDASLVRAAMSRGNRWMGANFQVDPPQWTYYYLYALERYESFREEAEGNVQKEPRWYNDGVKFLSEKQNENGSWRTNDDVPDTAFAVLFLLRSMKKSIERAKNYGSGMLVGGRGLPKDTDRVAVRDGKVVPKALLGAADQLVAALDDPNDPNYARAVEAISALEPKQAETLASKYRARLQKLAGVSSPEARAAAVRTLGASGSFDDVPTLIFALSDPDPSIVIEARNGLRRISRKFNGFGMPDTPTESQVRAAIEKWKAWFRGVRPDAEFED